MSPAAWLKAQVDSYQALVGVQVAEWRGHEMALDEGPDGFSPVWRHPDADALQFIALQLVTPRRVVTVQTAQTDDGFGLYRPDSEIWPAGIEHNATYAEKWDQPIELSAPIDPRSIYRQTLVPALPIGLIEEARVTLSERGTEIEEVVLDIRGQRVSLRAAEFRLEGNGGYSTSVLDECVLVQIDRRHPEGRSAT